MNIPEYYKQFQNQPAEEKKTEKPTTETPGIKSTQKQEQQKPKQTPQEKDKTIIFQGNGFTVNQLEDWQDKTLYTLTGPVSDGIQHNVIITIDKDISFDSVIDYAELHIKTLENELKSCTLLKKGETKLSNGTEAYEAIFKWYPNDELCIYQHQIFVIVEKTAFKMTASFTKKTLKTFGPQVERMMLSLNPVTNPKK